MRTVVPFDDFKARPRLSCHQCLGLGDRFPLIGRKLPNSFHVLSSESLMLLMVSSLRNYKVVIADSHKDVWLVRHERRSALKYFLIQ